VFAYVNQNVSVALGLLSFCCRDSCSTGVGVCSATRTGQQWISQGEQKSQSSCMKNYR
jgi:hypothetical protein